MSKEQFDANQQNQELPSNPEEVTTDVTAVGGGALSITTYSFINNRDVIVIPIYSPHTRPISYVMAMLNLYYDGSIRTAKVIDQEQSFFWEEANQSTIWGAEYERLNDVIDETIEFERRLIDRITGLETENYDQVLQLVENIDYIPEQLKKFPCPEEFIDQMKSLTEQMAAKYAELLLGENGANYLNPISLSKLVKAPNGLKHLEGPASKHLSHWFQACFEASSEMSCFKFNVETSEINLAKTLEMHLLQTYSSFDTRTLGDMITHIMRGYFRFVLLKEIITQASAQIDEVVTRITGWKGTSREIAAINTFTILHAFRNILNTNTVLRLAPSLFVAGGKAAEYINTEVLPNNHSGIIDEINSSMSQYLQAIGRFDPASGSIYVARFHVARLQREINVEFVDNIMPDILEDLEKLPISELQHYVEQYPNLRQVLQPIIEKLIANRPVIPARQKSAPPLPSKKTRPQINTNKLTTEAEPRQITTSELISERCILLSEDGSVRIEVKSKSDLESFIVSKILAPLDKGKDQTMLEKIKVTLVKLARSEPVTFYNVVSANGNFLTSYRIHFGPKERYRIIYAIYQGHIFLRVVFRPDNLLDSVGITESECINALDKFSLNES